MPCYTRTVVTANVEKWNKERAQKAISGTNARYSNGKIVANNETEINEVKRNYSKLTILEGAKKFGWAPKTTINQNTISINLVK